MEVLDATSLSERLKWEAKEYWLHLEAETPLEKYPARQHARRVQEKLGVEEGLIYLAGQPPRNNEDSDMPAPFRQRRYFYYLSGCNEPGCHVTYDIQHDTLSLFLPRIDEKRVIWNGRGSTLAEAMVKYDIDEVYYTDELSNYVADWFHRECNDGFLYYLHGAGSLEHPPRNSGSIVVDTTSLMPAMNIARMIKDDHEIMLIQKANDISSKAHKAVLANILTFKNEAQVQGLFLDVCVSRQAKEQAYDPIAASGPNAGTLHYDANNEDFGDRQLMCLDAGCEYQLYASDITRTFPLSSSWPSKEAENVYKLVERMQESCIRRLAPGVRYLDLHILAHQIAIDGLLALGILHNGTKEEIYRAGTSRAFFPHGLGHHVGLEVHDVGQAELMSVRRGKAILEQAPSLYPESFHIPVFDRATCLAPTDPQSSHLEEGMVVTVEPGIYFSVYALQHFYLPSPVHSKFINVEVLQRYLPVGGVRIEDDLLITSKGYRNLTTAPKGKAMLDIIRHGKSAKGTCAPQQRSSRHPQNNTDLPLLRAPGISNERPESILRPIARASTLPAEFRQRDSHELEPFDGPSLFSNFKRSMTTNERIRHWQQDRDDRGTSLANLSLPESYESLCGSKYSTVKHTYLAAVPGRSTARRPFDDVPNCKDCAILTQALGRLRASLKSPEHGTYKAEAKLTHTPETDPVKRQAQSPAGSTLKQESYITRPVTRITRKERSMETVSSEKFDLSHESTTPLPPHFLAKRASRPHMRPEVLANSPVSLPKQQFGVSRTHIEGEGLLAKIKSPDGPQHTNYLPPPPTAPTSAPRYSCQPIIKSEPSRSSLGTDIPRCDVLAHRGTQAPTHTQIQNTTTTEGHLDQRLARRATQSTRQAFPADSEAQARQVLEDLRIQRQNQIQSTRVMCTFGSEAHPDSSLRSLRGKLVELQAAIRLTEAQLHTHAQTLRTSLYADFQQGGLMQGQDGHYWERMKLEERLLRLRAKKKEVMKQLE
ncbi:hypothetical protein FB567DRAFT_532345 [Paraphoma chrysanthemicola]|uniref:Xaa-Pro aminopeptidase n=1 Tax=Paraphoma chrysanthemicola TaxID=798071 RepID=A0A8K0R1D4_9PLEO|nr:hypothetical protein FB567DRAFT_532345 [Paraphoma chrysanthemicola]